MLQSWLKITEKESRTFILHLIYSIIDGFILGLFALNEFILIKGLQGSNYQIGILFQFTVIVLLFAIIINEFFRRIRRKRLLIRYVGIITRLPLILFVFFPSANTINGDNFLIYQLAFLFIFLLYYMANPLLLPAINYLLKNSYSHENFGRLYGYASSANKILVLIGTFVFGLLLDKNQFAFTYIYPLIAFLGIFSIYILSKIDYTAVDFKEPKQKFMVSVANSFKNSIDILKRNKAYRDFEIAFMFYGFAWMATAAVITIFFEKQLSLNYSSIAFYKNSYNTLAIIILPYFGKLIGRIDPRKFAIYTFSSLLLFLLFMAITEYIPAHFMFWKLKIYYSLIISYIFYGLFAAMMALLWYIGSAYFCKNEEVSNYQSIHLSLTGIRGIFSPLVGVFFYELIGFTGVFAISILSLFISVLVMLNSMRKYKI